jgi:hypothetical protein
MRKSLRARKSDIELVIQRLNEYELLVRSDGVLLFDGKPMNRNQIKCMLRLDLEDQLTISGKERDFLLNTCITLTIQHCIDNKLSSVPTKTNPTSAPVL